MYLQFKPCALFKKRKSAEYQLRLCNSTFLENVGSEQFIKLYRRVNDFTGMNVNYSEELHVVQYWVGGYYAPHTDFWRVSFSVIIYYLILLQGYNLLVKILLMFSINLTHYYYGNDTEIEKKYFVVYISVKNVIRFAMEYLIFQIINCRKQQPI